MHNDVALMKSFLPNENEARQLQDVPPRIRRLPQQISIILAKITLHGSDNSSECCWLIFITRLFSQTIEIYGTMLLMHLL